MLTDFWDVLPFHSEGRYSHFGGTAVSILTVGEKVQILVQSTGTVLTSQPVAVLQHSGTAFSRKWVKVYCVGRSCKQCSDQLKSAV